MNRTPRADAPYHQLDFDEYTEGTAFIAALSRFLSGPTGCSLTPPEALEVWAEDAQPGLCVYLSEATLEAAQVAFSPVVVASTCHGERLSNAVRLVIEGSNLSAWGVKEALDQLSKP